jgi:pyruvate dehydrogenase E2 component (dihydrolipoamide acetyltransferase)
MQIIEEELTAGEAAVPSMNAGAPVCDSASKLDRQSATGLVSRAAEARFNSSPLARAVAQRAGIGISRIKGSGRNGRVVSRDVQEEIQRTTHPTSTATVAPALPLIHASEEIRVSGKRKIIAERLSQSKQAAPHYYIRISVCVENLIKTREKVNATREKKVSMNAFLLKFVAEAAKRNPMINSSWQDEKIVLFKSIDIGLAVAQEDGLITPIVRDCGSKGVLQIDQELKTLIDKALNATLKAEEYMGATFTMSNLGSFGIEEFTAIINPPGSATLAVGTIKREPVVDASDKICTQTRLRLTLSCDHRVIDGAVGAGFLKYLKDIVEDPVLILL